MRHCLDCNRVTDSPLCGECINEMCAEMDSVEKQQDEKSSVEFRQDVFCVIFGLIVIGVIILSQF